MHDGLVVLICHLSLNDFEVLPERRGVISTPLADMA